MTGLESAETEMHVSLHLLWTEAAISVYRRRKLWPGQSMMKVSLCIYARSNMVGEESNIYFYIGNNFQKTDLWWHSTVNMPVNCTCYDEIAEYVIHKRTTNNIAEYVIHKIHHPNSRVRQTFVADDEDASSTYIKSGKKDL